MTEEEAKTKWCPEARVPGRLYCIASACMMWRWREENRTAAYLQAVVEHMKATGENFNKATQEVVKRREEFAHTEGYCGLAGQL